jgi:diguanylate cyclase
MSSKASSRTGARSFWKLMHQVAVVAGGTHVLFMALFFGLGINTLAWVNLGSVILFAAAYGCLRARRNLAAVVLILVEIVCHAVFAVRAIGWDSGFHYYLLLIVPIVVTAELKWSLVRPMLIGLMLVIYVLLDHWMRRVTPLDQVDARGLSALRYFNIAVTFLLLAYLTSMYRSLVAKAERQLRTLATTDPLTQLLNRRSLQELADYEMVQRKRLQRPVSFVLADIDHFKSINDRFGHDAGDAVLVAVSRALRQTVREQDSVARWGGEEFLILMPNASIDDAREVAERLRQAVADIQIPAGDRFVHITMTFGVSCSEGQEVSDHTIKRADRALYQGKSSGRDQVVVA